ncbi:MAG: hypothetical protein EZS28_003385 [Streblomastix strix]|uniref:FCP1 homology domain-containing protein n=1 Tax=Streblomastix strix TaxID=222440 RepID=A0A5J4X1I1_9EUKA|nr:MAG: hypothetical protein EZS28_003385 [Streblomastix strix]
MEFKHGRSILDNKYGALWQNKDITILAKRGQIQLRLKKLLDVMSIKSKQVNSFEHSAAAQLVVIDLDETLLNTYAGNARNPKFTNEFFIFAERLKDNEIATKLSESHGQVECNFDKQVGELLIMVSDKLVSMRCQQSFMGGYVQAVRRQN